MLKEVLNIKHLMDDMLNMVEVTQVESLSVVHNYSILINLCNLC